MLEQMCVSRQVIAMVLGQVCVEHRCPSKSPTQAPLLHTIAGKPHPLVNHNQLLLFMDFGGQAKPVVQKYSD
jgi:hypothetical protein